MIVGPQICLSRQVTFDKEVMTRSVSLAGDVFDPAGTLTGGTYFKDSTVSSVQFSTPQYMYEHYFCPILVE